MNDTMGELMIYTMLGHYVSAELASKASEGWGGDRLYYYGNDTDFVSVFKIEWDSDAEASEFYNIYEQWEDALANEYGSVIGDNCLQIKTSGKVTTIYYGSSADIISQVME